MKNGADHYFRNDLIQPQYEILFRLNSPKFTFTHTDLQTERCCTKNQGWIASENFSAVMLVMLGLSRNGVRSSKLTVPPNMPWLRTHLSRTSKVSCSVWRWYSNSLYCQRIVKSSYLQLTLLDLSNENCIIFILEGNAKSFQNDFYCIFSKIYISRCSLDKTKRIGINTFLWVPRGWFLSKFLS